jgi:phenylacetate-CoA ligase
MSGLYTSFIDQIVEPIYDLIRGTSRHVYGRELRKTQWLARSELEDIQRRNLCNLIKHAYETVPFYHRVFDERGLTSKDINSVEDLRKLPILRKRDINENYHELISTTFNRRGIIPYQSGGSGEPVRFFVTKEKMSWEIAAEYRAYEWAGYHLGDPCLLLWGSSIDNSKEKGLVNRASKRLERIVSCDAFILSDDALAEFVEKARSLKPEIIRGYANAVYMLAKYCQENGVSDIKPRSIITSAEKLIDSRRKIIEDVFRSKVFDHYGSREIGAMASECEEHRGHHISIENIAVEIVKEGELVSRGERGAIIVTNLRNYCMPMIRYQIGDAGVLSEDDCVCGRGLPLLSSIEGRLSDYLYIRDKNTGKIIPYMVGSPGFVGAIFMEVPVNSYRVIQERIDKLRIQVVKGEGYSEEDTLFVVTAVRRFLEDNCEVEFEFMDDIPPLPSGKRSTFTSKLASESS